MTNKQAKQHTQTHNPKQQNTQQQNSKPCKAKPVYMCRAPSSGHEVGWLQTVIGLWHRNGYRSASIKYFSSCCCDRLPEKRILRENRFISGFRTGDCSLSGREAMAAEMVLSVGVGACCGVFSPPQSDLFQGLLSQALHPQPPQQDS